MAIIVEGKVIEESIGCTVSTDEHYYTSDGDTDYTATYYTGNGRAHKVCYYTTCFGSNGDVTVDASNELRDRFNRFESVCKKLVCRKFFGSMASEVEGINGLAVYKMYKMYNEDMGFIMALIQLLKVKKFRSAPRREIKEAVLNWADEGCNGMPLSDEQVKLLSRSVQYIDWRTINFYNRLFREDLEKAIY